jgi:penicillin amidase
MTRRTAGVVVATVALAALGIAGARPVGSLPPLGPLLDPVRGVWSATTTTEHPAEVTVAVPSLRAPVEVRYDQRGVPHIFAATEEDVVRALGYVVARDRLFQLVLQARAGAGTLSELIGPAALSADSEPRHLGMPRAAQRHFAELADTSVAKRLMNAYAEGVNAYVDGLPRDAWPVEYKLLGRRPARWQPINTIHLFNRMGHTLTYRTPEADRGRVERLIGADATAALFPVASPIQEPIEPNGTTAPWIDRSPLPAPGDGATSRADSAAAPDTARARPAAPPEDFDVGSRFASNNWAVAPARSRSGRALLAGDPHLELTLPSIWYEVHLVVPARLDVYGVTIPGATGVIIGFTPNVAWSMTNTGADVLDFYRETVDDQDHPARYLVDSTWRDLELREEVYRGPAGNPLRVDTVRFSHRGPLGRRGSDWLSMRWTVLEAGDLVTTFHRMAGAVSATELLDVAARDFLVPAQNIIVADRTGTIAIRSTGRYPIRPPGTTGLATFDGSSSQNDWQGYWPVDRYPQSVNPPQGYLASANQQPKDPRADAGYLGDEASFDPWRALQINRLLRADSLVSVDAMRRYQTDGGSVRADLFVEQFRAVVARAAANGRPLSAEQRAADRVLAEWNRQYTVDNVGAVLFEAVLSQVARRTWDELIPAGDSLPVARPSAAMLLRLLQDSASAWWDDHRTTGEREDRDGVVLSALADAYESLVGRYGDPARGGWAWGKVATSQVNHLLGLRGFSRRDIPLQGGRGTLNPSVQNGGFGASWRMVVELGPRVRALGTYPGGQSGNPASPRYADRLRHWARGDLELLVSPPVLDSFPAAQVRAALTLTPSGR